MSHLVRCLSSMAVLALPACLVLAVTSSLCSPTCRAAEQPSAKSAPQPPVVVLWPDGAPGETGDVGEEHELEPRGEKPVTRLTNVTKPRMTIYRPAQADPGHAAVLVCPGGGYNILAMDLEGTEVAEWLNSIGVTAAVLKYRVPRRADRPKHEAPLQDAQRAISLLRHDAKKWGINPERIGILGFSAGGHLSATTATNSDKRAYLAIDAADKASCRPDFAVLCYPAYLCEDGKLTPEIRVGPQTPPCFFVHADDDRHSAENSATMYLALHEAKVPAELHIFATGGHGFGLRPSAEFPCSGWPKLCEAWMRTMGMLGADAQQ